MGRVAVAAVAALAIAFLFSPLASCPAQAHTFNHNETFLFHDVTIGPLDVVNGDLNVIFGNVVVQGVVHGNLNVVGGSCDYAGGTVDGQVNCVQTASLNAVAPWVGSYVGGLPLGEQTNRLGLMLAANLVVFLIFLLFPVRVRLALGRVETHPGLAAVIGTGAFVAIVPLAILLLLSIVGIPLIVLEIAAVFVGVWIGQGAIALLVGRRLAELVRPSATPSPLTALILGLVVVSAAEIVPVVGWAVTALISLIGLGAAILSFVRDAPTPVVVVAGRPTIGGPPMASNR